MFSENGPKYLGRSGPYLSQYVCSVEILYVFGVINKIKTEEAKNIGVRTRCSEE